MPPVKQPVIVIIGAGMAGLSAARRLYDTGFVNIRIFEASNRIGGRICTDSFGNDRFPVELGANWIHGASWKNSTFKLAEEAGLLNPYRILSRVSARFMREDGTEIAREIVTKTWYIFKRVFEDISEQIQRDIRNGTNTVLLGDVLKSEINKNLEKHFLSDTALTDSKRVLNSLINYQSMNEGDDLNKIAWETDVSDIEGGEIHVPSGYKRVLLHLSNGLPKDIITFQTEIVKIKWSDADETQVEMCDKTGKHYLADHVILTVSIGYLKKNHLSLFEPALPNEKIEAMKHIGFGRVNKLFLEFDKPLTKPSYKFIAFAWDDLDIKFDKSQWFKRIFGFDQLFTRDTTLLGWISGDAAEHMETLTDEQITDTCVCLLRKFLNDNSIQTPKNVTFSRWCSDEFTLGSYSYLKANAVPGSQAILAQPLTTSSGKPVVMFAGEATHSLWYASTHGARDTGIREAEHIIQQYNCKMVKSNI